MRPCVLTLHGVQRFEVCGELFVVVLILRGAQNQHNNKFSLFSQKAFPNFELLHGVRTSYEKKFIMVKPQL